jgi:hypothetical protein
VNNSKANPLDDHQFLKFVDFCEKDNKDYFNKVKDYDQKIMKAALENSFMKFVECDKCQKAENLRLCGRCKEVSYCSEECQNAAWQIHKSVCQEAILENLVLSKEVPDWIADFIKPFYIEIENTKLFKEAYMHDKVSKKKTIVFLSCFCNLISHELPNGTPVKLVTVNVNEDQIKIFVQGM